MIEQDAFEKEIVESAQNICKVLKARQNTKKDRVVRKKIKTENTSVLKYFKPIPSTPVVKEEEEEKEEDDKEEEDEEEFESEKSESSNQDSDEEIDLK